MFGSEAGEVIDDDHTIHLDVLIPCDHGTHHLGRTEPHLGLQARLQDTCSF